MSSSETISPTAHYTGYVWARNGLSHPSLETAQGRLLFTEFLNVRKRLGELRDDADVEASAAFFLSALTFILLVVELFGGKQVEALDEERLVRSMSDLFLKGVAI